jgi:hypothetical protein
MLTLEPLSLIVPLDGADTSPVVRLLPDASAEAGEFADRTASNSASIRRAVELFSYAMTSSASFSGNSRLAKPLLPFLTVSISCDVFRLIVELTLIRRLDADETRVCSSVSSGDPDNSARSSSAPEESEEGKRVALDEGSKEGESKSLNSLAAFTVKSTARVGQNESCVITSTKPANQNQG